VFVLEEVKKPSGSCLTIWYQEEFEVITTCEISGSHSSEYEDNSLLGYCAM